MKVITKERSEAKEPELKRVKLDRWSKVYGDRLHGMAYGHPNFPDGSEVTTSKVIWMAGNLAQTHNTLYELLAPL